MDESTTTNASQLQQIVDQERLRNQELLEANKALVEEFSKADTYEEQTQVAKNAICDILPSAIINMKQILGDNKNENTVGTRASLSKYVLETVLGGKLDKAGESAVGELLKKLAENDTKTETEA